MTQKYSHERYDELVAQTIEEIRSLSELKGGEYAGDVDRLANFRRNAEGLGLRMEQVWAVYAAKHWDAITQYVKDLAEGKERKRLEHLGGRADDLIVYLILFKAILDEGKGPATFPKNGTIPQEAAPANYKAPSYPGGF